MERGPTLLLMTRSKQTGRCSVRGGPGSPVCLCAHPSRDSFLYVTTWPLRVLRVPGSWCGTPLTLCSMPHGAVQRGGPAKLPRPVPPPESLTVVQAGSPGMDARKSRKEASLHPCPAGWDWVTPAFLPPLAHSPFPSFLYPGVELPHG